MLKVSIIDLEGLKLDTLRNQLNKLSFDFDKMRSRNSKFNLIQSLGANPAKSGIDFYLRRSKFKDEGVPGPVQKSANNSLCAIAILPSEKFSIKFHWSTVCQPFFECQGFQDHLTLCNRTEFSLIYSIKYAGGHWKCLLTRPLHWNWKNWLA